MYRRCRFEHRNQRQFRGVFGLLPPRNSRTIQGIKRRHIQREGIFIHPAASVTVKVIGVGDLGRAIHSQIDILIGARATQHLVQGFGFGKNPLHQARQRDTEFGLHKLAV